MQAEKFKFQISNEILPVFSQFLRNFNLSLYPYLYTCNKSMEICKTDITKRN